MKKHIENYVSLYVGCELLLQEGIGINLGLYYPDVWSKEGRIESNGINVYFTESSVKGKVYAMNFNQCKLSLRPLSDITEHEMSELKWDKQELEHAISQKRNPNFYNTEFLYLLQKGFDLFGLIEEGIAVDKTTLVKVVG